MNRSQRRALHSKNFSDAEIDKIKSILSKEKSSSILLEGQAVRLNVEKIKSHPSYDQLRPEYKEFVEKNAGKVFAVEYDERHSKLGILVALKEDTTNPKWLFWTGDLEVVENV